MKDQELRNAKYFGDFKSSVYVLAKNLVTFFETHKIFSSAQILRMQEAEFISELLIAVHEGIRDKSKTLLDGAYKKYDNAFPNRSRYESRVKSVFDLIGNILGDGLLESRLRGGRLFYPLFCALYHMQYGLPKLTAKRSVLKPSSYTRVRINLEEVHRLVNEWELARKKDKEMDLTAEQRKFITAYAEHWVHASNRTTLTQFICRRIMAE